jgi:hypothetical protein
MKSFLSRQILKVLQIVGLVELQSKLQSLLDLYIQEEQNYRKKNHTNPFVLYGNKCFSQTDEDGITLEIINRLKLNNGNFIEFGVGDGMENNTLILLTLGWKGYWFGGQDLNFSLGKSNKLTFEKIWITNENIIDLCRRVLDKVPKIDLISIDLDGNDYHIVKKILENNIFPSVFIVEYNAKFFPPIEFVIDYKSDHTWDGDDYFGASLASFNILFERFNYSLICCNSDTGANSFFIKKEFMRLFPEVPSNLNDIYCSPFYYLPSKHGHKQSVKTIEQIINSERYVNHNNVFAE